MTRNHAMRGDVSTQAHFEGSMRSDAMRVARYGNTRYWAVLDADGTLVCLCVYRKGAQEVVKRLQAREKEGA